MKKYNDKVKLIKSENDASGGKRSWWEVSDDEAIMLKFPPSTTVAKMTEIADAKLTELKYIDSLQTQLEQLEQQAQAIKEELGIE